MALENTKLKVKSIHRVSHPAYTFSNYAWTKRNLFNVDYSRIILYESGTIAQSPYGMSLIHPDFNVTGEIRINGRGNIWGCISNSGVIEASRYHSSINSTLQNLDLDNARGGSTENRKLTSFDNNTIQIPSKYELYVQWSPFAGETNLIYALNKSTRMLVTYNVDNEIETSIISYALPGWTADELNKLRINGFTTTGSPSGTREVIIDGPKAIRVYLDRQLDGSFRYPTRTEPAAGAKTCSLEACWWSPYLGSVHTDQSPDGAYFIAYGMIQTIMKNDYSGNPCYYYGGPPLVEHWWEDKASYNVEYAIAHVSWKLGPSNVWYIGSNYNAAEGACESCFQNKPYYPHLTRSRITQVIFNRDLAEANLDKHSSYEVPGLITHIPLIVRTSAGLWIYDKNYPDKLVNYHGLPSAAIAPDGLHLYFHGTNGKYTRDDKGVCQWLASNQSYVPNYPITKTKCDAIGNNWEGIGAYIAELEPQSSIPDLITDFKIEEL